MGRHKFASGRCRHCGRKATTLPKDENGKLFSCPEAPEDDKSESRNAQFGEEDVGLETATRLTIAVEVRKITEEIMRPKLWHTRTASMCWEERDVRLCTHPSSFQLCELPTIAAFDWPVLADDVLEDAKEPTGPTVQSAASEHFPLFVKHVGKETGRNITTDFIDTHNKPLSNGMKPDGVHVVRGSQAAPAVVVAIQELKARRGPGHFTASEMEHCISFGLQLLIEEPMRESIICYLSDMHLIQFFNVHIDHIIMSEPMLLRGAGERWLAALLTTDIRELGNPAVSRAVQFDARTCHYETLLGQGGSAFVFVPQREPEDPDAFPDDTIVKVDVSPSGESVQREFDNLEELRGACAAAVAPQLAPTQPSAALHSRPPLPPAPANMEFVFAKMIPQEYQLSDCKSALRMRWLGTRVEFRRKTFAYLVDYLQLLHACGYAHTDIHPNNLVMRGGQVVAIDYGSLAPLYQRSMYRGNVVCASDRVLRELHSGPFMFPIFPADDLHALVRCVFMLLVPQVGRFHFEESLRIARGAGVRAADCKVREFWLQRLRGRTWEPMVRHAEECNYAALKDDLLDLFVM